MFDAHYTLACGCCNIEAILTHYTRNYFYGILCKYTHSKIFVTEEYKVLKISVPLKY